MAEAARIAPAAHQRALVAIPGRGALAGTGVCVLPRALVLTCAHVVNTALGRDQRAAEFPDRSIPISPVAASGLLDADVVAWSPHDHFDVALLKVRQELPDAVHATPIFDAGDLADLEFDTYGFPKGYHKAPYYGRSAQGKVVVKTATGRYQVEHNGIEEGFSGAPVRDLLLRRVIGIVAASDNSLAFITPSAAIADICAAAGHSLEVIRLDYPFEILTAGLEMARGNVLSSVEALLSNYLGGPSNPAPFGGRADSMRALNEWVGNPAKPFALMAYPPGRGKTTTLVRWAVEAAAERSATVVFVPVSLRFNTARRADFLQIWASRLLSVHASARQAPPDREDEIVRLIDQILRADWPADRAPLVTILDGVDEATDWKAAEALRFPIRLGRNVKALIAARILAGQHSEQDWIQQLGWAPDATSLIPLPPLDRNGIREVLRAPSHPARRFADDDAMIDRLLYLTGGDPFELSLYSDAISDLPGAFLDEKDLESLQPGLKTFFHKWWSYQRSRGLAQNREALNLLHLLSCALGPLERRDIQAIAGDSELSNGDILDEALQAISRFVIGDGLRTPYSLSHPRIRLFQIEEMGAARRASWDAKILQYCLDALDKPASSGRPARYQVQFLGAHLEAAGALREMLYRLVDSGWVRAWEDIDGPGVHTGFLKDLDRAWRAAVQSRDLPMQIKCALCASSVAAASDVPGALLADAIRAGLITPLQAMNVIRQNVTDYRVVEALEAVFPLLADESLRSEAIRLARGLAEPEWIASVLAAAIPCVPEQDRPRLLQESYALAIQTGVESTRVRLLTALIPHWPDAARQERIDEAAQLAQRLDYRPHRAEALISLLPVLTGKDRKEALETAFSAVAYEDDDAPFLEVVRAAPAPLPERIEYRVAGRLLEFQMAGQDARFRALAAAAYPKSSPKLRKVVNAHLLTGKLDDERILTLSELLPYMDPAARRRGEALLEQHLEKAGVEARCNALIALARVQRENALRATEAYACAGTLELKSRLLAYADILPLAPAELRRRMESDMLRAAIEPAEVADRLRAIATVAPLLPSPLKEQALREAFDAARQIGDEFVFGEFLLRLSDHLTGDNHAAALALVEEVFDRGGKHKVREYASDYSEQVLGRVIEVAARLPDWDRVLLLEDLPVSTPELRRKVDAALADATRRLDRGAKARALLALARNADAARRKRFAAEAWEALQPVLELVPAIILAELAHLREEPIDSARVKQYAVDILTRGTNSFGGRTDEVTRLVELFPNHWRTVVDGVNSTQVPTDFEDLVEFTRMERLERISRLAPAAAEAELLSLAWSLREKAKNPFRAALVRARMLPLLPAADRTAAIREVHDRMPELTAAQQAEVASALVPHVHGEHRSKLLRGVLDSIVTQTTKSSLQSEFEPLNDGLRLWAREDPDEAAAGLAEILHRLSRWRRPQLFRALTQLTPFLLELSGARSADAIAAAARQVTGWWP
ncbi:MAG TPA: serine protease [Bryobacteraceae bacterium]|nr:serine protease [Bryobacteraceae bacterium]